MGTISTRYHWTEAQKARMKALYEEGYSFQDVALKMGCTYETIRHHLKKMGIQFRPVGMHSDIARSKYSGSKHHGWKGGRRIETSGYVLVLKRDHPLADKDGYVREHWLVMERHMLRIDPSHPALVGGHLDTKNWMVHHKHGNKSDNRFSELELMPRAKHHSWLHYWEHERQLRVEIARLQALLDTNGIAY